MELSLPLNDCHPRKTQIVINRLHAFIHGISILPLFYYRITSITSLINNTEANIPILPHILLFISELTLSFIWLLSQASKWNPIVRTAYPERLPGDEHLPPIDVFICTTDPNKEPSLQVMNTVISALALDYPPSKLHVYLSDDGGSSVTFRAVKEAWKFSKVWIPFCRKYEVKNRCPERYFSREGSDDGDDYVSSNHELFVDKMGIEKAYDCFKNSLAKIGEGTNTQVSRDHPPHIEVIGGAHCNGMESDTEEMPLFVYVAREKRTSQPHHFKAGALNVLIPVSSLISNSPYILVLDCDMFCNDPGSARQAMCFHLDPKLSPKLAFVQFPQKFHNISQSDIYDGQLRFVWPKWEGLDGLRGPVLSGTGFYIKREALIGTHKFRHDVGFKDYLGSSKELIKSINNKGKTDNPSDRRFDDKALQKELHLLASCSYDNGTKWGEEVGFRYFAVVEDYFTGLNLHCEGWVSVYYEPSKPCFMGSSPITLSEVLVQHTRWNVGLNQVALSKFSPLVFGPLRMPISQCFCYAEFAYSPLYFVSLYILALVPQIYLLRGIPLYPEVSSPFFLLFSFLFISSQLKHIQEVFAMGYSVRTWSIEQRMWMMRSLTSYLYATMDAIRDKMGVTKASFLPTNKVVDDEAVKRYQMGVYDFQAPPLFMVPLCTLYILNLASFVLGFTRVVQNGKHNEMVVQVFIPLFAIALHYPLLEGMVFRKDKGRVSPSVSLVSLVVSSVVLAYASLGSYY